MLIVIESFSEFVAVTEGLHFFLFFLFTKLIKKRVSWQKIEMSHCHHHFWHEWYRTAKWCLSCSSCDVFQNCLVFNVLKEATVKSLCTSSIYTYTYIYIYNLIALCIHARWPAVDIACENFSYILPFRTIDL